MHRIILRGIRPLGRLTCFTVLALLTLALPAAVASARGYFDGGAVLADSPTTMANDGTVYAFRFSAADVPDDPDTLYPTPALAPNQVYYVKVRLTTNWQSGEPASTDNRGFMWNPKTGRWVFWDADWTEFPSVATDGSGNIVVDERSPWYFVKFSDTTETGKYGLIVSLSIGGTGNTLNGRTWPTVTVYNPATNGGWVHAGNEISASAATPVRVYDHGTSVVPVSTAVTETNGCDDDSNGVVDDEQPGEIEPGGFRVGVRLNRAVDVSLGGVLWPDSDGFTVSAPDTDIALGAKDRIAPTAPGALRAAPRNGAVVLTWPAASDSVGVTEYRIYRWIPAPLGSTYTADAVPIATVGATTTYTDATAANGTTYYYMVRALDAATNVGPRSPAASATPDGTPPAPATSLVATPGDRQVSLSWTRPSSADLAGVMIVRKPGATAPSGPEDGTVVYMGTASSCTDTGLTNGQTYAYAAFAYDAALNYASASVALATPNIVTELTLTAGKAVVAWGGAWTYSGALTTAAGEPVPGASVRLQQSVDGGAVWTNVDPSPSLVAVPGAFFGSGPILRQTSRFRLAFDGDAHHLGATSKSITVSTRVALGKPVARSRAGVKKAFKAKGSLRPKPPSGISVKIRCYQLARGKWKLKKTVRTKLKSGRYAATLSLPSRGAWKLVAYAPKSSKFAATTSGARKVTVR